MMIVQTVASSGITGSGTAGTIPLLATTTSLSDSIITQSGTSSITVAGKLGVNATAAVPTHFVDIAAGALSSTQAALSVTATLSSTVATQNGVVFTITGAGSGSQNVNVVSATLNAGYTGTGQATVLLFANSAAGTGSNYFAQIGNFGVAGITNGSTATGHNVGGWFNARNGLNNVGVFGRAIVSTNAALNIGAFGAAVNATVNVGGFFGFYTTAPTIASSCALIADNRDKTDDIFRAADNGTAVFTIADGGAVTCTGVLAIGNTVNSVSPTSPNRTVTIAIGGTTYYLHAKTTND